MLPSSSVVQGRTQGRSWSAAKGSPELHVLTDIKALRKECPECNVTKPQVFASGWMCLSGECALFWTLNGISCARGSELQSWSVGLVTAFCHHAMNPELIQPNATPGQEFPATRQCLEVALR